MSVKGFKVRDGLTTTIEKYDYASLADIPPIAESIEDIKNAVFVDLLDGITLQPGYIQTGGGWSDSQSANNLEVGTKDFVPVTPGYALLYNAIYTERPWGAIAFYDENKAMVGARTVLNNLVSHTVCIVPENAIYVKVCFSSKYLKSKYVGYTASQSIISEVIHGSAIHSDLFPFIGSGDLDLKTLLPDKYITIDKGNEANYSGYSATTYLACYGMHKFIATITDGDGLEEHWFYDKDQNPIPDSKFALPQTGTVEIEIPSDAYYVRFSNKTAAMNTLKVEWWLKDEVDKVSIHSDLFPLVGSGNLDLKTLLPDKYITISKGNEANYSGYSATTYLACYGMHKFIATITDGDGLAENWFYDKDQNPIPDSKFALPKTGTVEIEIPSDAYYVRFSNKTAAMNTLKVEWWLKEEVDKVPVHNNLFPFIGSGDLDLKTLLPDKYITINGGNEANYSGYSATTYLACYGMHKFIATITDGDGLEEHWFYDKDQNPIPDSKFALPQTGTVEIEIPSDAYYVRFSNKTAAMNTLKVEWWLAHEVKEIPEQNDIIVNTSDLEQLIVQGRREYRPWNSDTTVPLPLVFSVITDIHGDADNLKRYTEFSKHYSDYIDEKLCLGDMVVSFFSSDITYWDNMENTDDILRTIGNHDVWLSYDRPIQNAPKVDAYAKYYTGKTSKWGIVQPSNAETNGLMYYYKDYTSQKLRLVVTDCMYWDSAEKTWFTNVLNDAKTNGYSVLCTSHYNLSKTDLTPIANFYSSDIGSSQLVTNWGASDAIEVVDNFITGGGEFVGWLSGDSHYDYCAVYTHPTSGNKQVTLTLENAWCNQAWNDSNRVRGTQTQDSFNLVSIDTYSKLIKVLRIGNCYDRSFRSKKYFVYDYTNHTLISSL